MIHIDSEKVKAFYALSVAMSFSKASKTLGITQSGLSQKVAKLEEELETTLVVRTTRSLQLTEAGQKLVQYYRTKLELDQSFLANLVSESAELMGELKLASYSSILGSKVVPALGPLIRQHGIRFGFYSMETYELKQALTRGEVDFIVSNEEFKKEGVVNKEIGVEENIHILPKSKNEKLPFLDHDEQDVTTYDFFKAIGKSADFERCFMDDIHTIINGVENGIGQAIVSKHLIEGNKKVFVKSHKKKMKSPIYLSYMKRPYYSQLQKEVIALFESKGLG